MPIVEAKKKKIERTKIKNKKQNKLRKIRNKIWLGKFLRANKNKVWFQVVVVLETKIVLLILMKTF